MRNNLKRSFIITVALLQVVLFPHAGFATGSGDDTGSSTTNSATPSTSNSSDKKDAPTTDSSKPTGPDADTFIYNEKTGLWENAHYTWDPVTKKTAPKPGTFDYSYNPETGHWDTNDWRYDSGAGKYVENVAQPIALSVESDADSAGSNNKALGVNSPITTNTNTSANGAFDLFYNAKISNKISSIAQTGDATVNQNKLGGNAGTGDASDMATILNMLQSVWDPSNGEIASFTADINGDVNGDITIDPAQIPKNLSMSNDTTSGKLTVNESEKASITNDIDLTAKSGDATVSENVEGGNATTGTAKAVANVVNLLNSYITAGQSFVGTVNVNGNLNGDILLPPEMLDELLASDVPKATIDMSKVNNANLLAQFNSSTAIKNTVDAKATTGNANVTSNVAAGDATTGNADTNVTFLNLTGRQIIGSNALLVFVNVRGNWVGMIMNAPGATSAVIGGGITNNTTNADASINSNQDASITNNIKLTAESGDATVNRNVKAGNAKSGNASASANIANVSNSKLSLSGWFGVLFINVFGNWLGSFGVNTSAGNAPAAPAAQQQDVQVFGFTPKADGGFSLSSVPTTGNLGTDASNNNDFTANAQVLGASTVKPIYANTPAGGLNPIARAYIIMAFIGLAITAGSKLIAFIRTRRSY